MTLDLNRRALLGQALLAQAGVLALGACAGGGGGGGIGANSGPPDGTVRLRMVQAAYLGNAGSGAGTLTFRGRDYPFNITGGGIGGVGMAEVEAWGRVYSLPDLYRFPGAYAEARSGFVLGTVGQGQLWLQNESGVFLHLAAQREGLMLSFGADAMVIQMA